MITHVRGLGRALATRGRSARGSMKSDKKESVRDGVIYALKPNLFRFIFDVSRRAEASVMIPSTEHHQEYCAAAPLQDTQCPGNKDAISESAAS